MQTIQLVTQEVILDLINDYLILIWVVQMLLELPDETISMFNELRRKSTAQIKETLTVFGVEFDPTLDKEHLLEKFYMMLAENCRAENGMKSYSSLFFSSKTVFVFIIEGLMHCIFVILNMNFRI